MKNHIVVMAVSVVSYASVEVEASDEAEAKRIVSESIANEGFSSPFWFEAEGWETDMNNADDLRVI